MEKDICFVCNKEIEKGNKVIWVTEDGIKAFHYDCEITEDTLRQLEDITNIIKIKE